MKITRLTKASEEDAFLLSSIAKQAKAYWEYPAEWLELWGNDLTFSADFLNQHYTYVLMIRNQVIGFLVIIAESDHYEVDHCWVLPQYMGQGYGAKLLAHALSEDKFMDETFTVLSDPNAHGFYQKFGFETIEMVASQPEGRQLPLMRMINTRK